MNRRLLKLTAVLFAVIVFGGTVFLSASSEKSESNQIYNQSAVLKSIEPQHLEDPVSWMKDLDKIIPPEERSRITETSPEKLNTTEKFAQELLKIIDEENLTKDGALSLSKTKANLSEHEDFFANFIKKELQSVIPEEKFFQENTLSIQKNPNKEDVIRYGNTVGQIIKENSPHLDHEAVIFKKLIENGGRQEEMDLRKIAQGYKNIAEEASKLIVPEDALTVHLDFINLMKTNSLIIEEMSFLQKDPLLAILSFNHYLNNSPKAFKSAKDVANYFEKRGVFFQLHENGAFFTFIKYE